MNLFTIPSFCSLCSVLVHYLWNSLIVYWVWVKTNYLWTQSCSNTECLTDSCELLELSNPTDIVASWVCFYRWTLHTWPCPAWPSLVARPACPVWPQPQSHASVTLMQCRVTNGLWAFPIAQIRIGWSSDFWLAGVFSISSYHTCIFFLSLIFC